MRRHPSASRSLGVRLSLVLAVLLASSACSSGLDTIDADATVIVGRQTEALAAGTLTSVSGTYTHCRSHADGALWSVSVGGGTLPNAALSVVRGDVPCQ